MGARHTAESDVFSAREIARAAGVPLADVHLLLLSTAGPQPRAHFFSFADAAQLVRTLRHEPAVPLVRPHLFAARPRATHRVGGPLAATSGIHAVLFTLVLLIPGSGAQSTTPEEPRDGARLVFLAVPGPGGGGGGGGLREPARPSKARLKGRAAVASPVSVARRTEPARADRDRAVEPPPAPVPSPELMPAAGALPPPIPPVEAPVASAPADAEDRAGVLEASSQTPESHGPGADDGAGGGLGGGVGEGAGSGIGPGTTAGIGGGPYRPGAGIVPPSLRREVQPLYTEEARRRAVEGEVLLEVVVRADGRVGSIRVLRDLGAGLGERAADAVRQWEFEPARRHGTPVDVLVEVAVEFRLR